MNRMTGLKAVAAVVTMSAMLGYTPAMMLMAQDQSAGNPQDSAGNSQDSTTDSNVMTALGTATDLSDVAITTNTAGGVVTLTGVVRSQQQKDEAGRLTRSAQGVTRVVNNLTISTAPPPAQTSQNNLPATAQMDNSDEQQENMSPQGQSSVAGQPGADQNGQQGQYDQQGQPQGPPDAQQNYPQGGPQGGPGNYPPQGRPQYQGQGQYAGQYPQGRPMRRPQQEAGRQVTVPPGATLRVRTLQPLDARNVKAGAQFSAVVLNDVISGGAIAIPRGAMLQGAVVESKKSGDFGGRGKLIVTLTGVSIGQSYPIVTDVWSNLGPSKTGQTVGSAIGLGAVGALIGAAAGGGAGAAIGAAAGGGAGIAASGASHTFQPYIPAEAVLVFHLQQPLNVTTVGTDELIRLAQNVPPMQRQPMMYRRGPYGYPGAYPPPPPPNYPY